MTDVSPFAPASVSEPVPIAGVRLATAMAGIKVAGRKDVALMAFDEGTSVAGVLTRSRCASAPVEWCKARIPAGGARALLVNSGNANAFTGQRGAEAARLSAELAASALSISSDEVFLASTGVIGEPLSETAFAGVMDGLSSDLSPTGWADAGRAIMTTDTFPKVASRTVTLAGGPVRINGIAKGAGMIAPDMATMLSFVATDAAIPAQELQSMLRVGANASFNRITVDSDTSTSDTLLAFATGGSGLAVSPADTPAFTAAFNDLLHELATLVVKDGEGCTKFVTVRVRGAESDASADIVARAIADSPLVKTAVAGEDANWGRVVMAVGKAGEPAERDKLAIWFGDVRVAVDGARDPAYDEEVASAVMRESEITVTVDLGIGSGEGVIYTCDLTKAYVAINGDYRT